MQGAAELKAACQAGLEAATRDLFRTAGIEELLDLRWHERGRDLGFAQSGLTATSLRALNFQPRARRILERLGERECVSLGETGAPRFTGAYLFALLRSEPMFRLLRSMSVGGKQQDMRPAGGGMEWTAHPGDVQPLSAAEPADALLRARVTNANARSRGEVL